MYGKQNKCCFVPGCKSTSVSTAHKIFVTVPRDYERKKKWFKAARRDMPKSQSLFFCCEDHFNLEEDMENYIRFKLIGGNVIMKKDVVPHKFDLKRAASAPDHIVPTKRERKPQVEEAFLTAEHTGDIENLPVPGPSTMPDVLPAEPESQDDVQRSIGIQVQVRPTVRSKYVQCELRPSIMHSAVSPIIKVQRDAKTSPHVKMGALKKVLFPTSSSSDTGEEESSTFTPSTSSSTSEKDVLKDWKEEEALALNVTRATIERAPKFYIGIPESWPAHLLPLLSEKTKLNKDNILLALMKIKQNDSFLRLGHMFGTSTANASKIFAKTLIRLEYFLQTLIFWPSSERIKYFMPIPFRARYSNVQSIVDCLEIEIEKPKDPVKQALTWSEYKKANTLKYLISCTPDGFINFVSSGYGGRISDSLLVQTCGYLSLVPEGSSVMADRGFKEIGKHLHERNCILVRPPSVSSSAKPTRDEVMESKRIASLRIHIERVIRRVREFEYLKPHAVINHNLIACTDSVIKVACALINLQNPIIKQE